MQNETEQLVGKRLGAIIKPGQGTPAPAAQTQRYLLTSLLGKQTGRRTFLAEDLETGQSVVVKLVLFGPDFTWEDLKLFEREAETLKSLDHPAIPQYLDSFEVDTPLGQGFALVQTYIEAPSLQEWVNKGSTFGEDELRAIARDLLIILEYLHHRQPPVIHRDIKPSNILFAAPTDTTPGGIYLVDFGSVQTNNASGTITIVGTYGYMPPEQFGGRAQPASDIYSVGATLIYLATGQHPAELMQANLQLEFDDRHLSESFNEWLRHLTYADLARRTSSASQALQQLSDSKYSKHQSLTRTSDNSTSGKNSSNILKSSFADFTVDATSNNLVIQFSEFRAVLKQKKSRDRPFGEMSPVTALIMVANIVFFSILAESGFIAPDESPMPVVCFFAITFTLMLAAEVLIRMHRLKVKSKPCQLRLLSASKNSVLLSLFKMKSVEDSGWINSEPQSSKPILPPRMLLHLISNSSGFLKDKVTFLVSDNEHKEPQTISITGNRREILWLCEHISRWGLCEMKDNLKRR